MKKAMLFVLAFLFTVSAHAATLTLSPFESSANATQSVTVPTGSTVIAQGTVNPGGNWYSEFDLSTDADTQVKISVTFNQEVDLTNAYISFGEVGSVPLIDHLVNGSFTFVTTLFADAFDGYFIGIFDAVSTGPLSYDLNVKTVPVPAAVFLFAPALLGLVGLRRKGQLKAA